MRQASIPIVLATFFCFTLSGFSFVGSPLKAKPFTFVGTAAQCAPGPAGIDTVSAAWQTHQGLPDAGGSDHALFLEKLGSTSNCAAAGAVIDGVAGITLTEIGWDVRTDGHCGAGAPRFNVVTSDNVLHFIGCNSPPPSSITVPPGSPDPRGNTWERRRYDPATAFPPIAPGSTVKSITIIFDEGTDTGPDFTGHVFVDNIDIDGVLIGKPGNAQ